MQGCMTAESHGCLAVEALTHHGASQQACVNLGCNICYHTLHGHLMLPTAPPMPTRCYSHAHAGTCTSCIVHAASGLVEAAGKGGAWAAAQLAPGS